MIRQLLMEGPVGHMWHPFDLDSVQSGKDLLSVFENEVIQYINEFTPSIKIDGINAAKHLLSPFSIGYASWRKFHSFPQ